MEDQKLFKSAIRTFLGGATVVFTVAITYCYSTGQLGMLGMKMLFGAIGLISIGIFLLLRK